MQVILLAHIRKLGKLGDLVKVKPGFARNFLLPFGKAKAATKQNLSEFEENKAALEKQEATLIAKAQEHAAKLQDNSILIKSMASDEGRLYGSVSRDAISQAIEDTVGINIPKKDIILSESALHSVGEYEISIQLHGDLTASITLKIERQSSSNA